MRRYLSLIALILIFPSLVFAQGTLSVKDLDTKLTTYYYTKTATDALLNDKASTASVTLKANAADVNTTAEITALLADKADTVSVSVKADKAYVDATDEILAAGVAAKANTTDVYTTAAVDLLLLDKADTAAVAAKADKSYVDGSDEVFLAHTNATSGAHAATAISTTNWTNVQTCIDSIENAINGIITGSGFATMAWTNSTLETNFYTQAQTNATIEAAISGISTNRTVSVTAGESLTAGDVVSLINNYGTVTAKKNNLTVNTSPNGSESVFNSAATTYCSAVALDSTRFLVAYRDSDTYGRAIVGTVSGSSISWGSESAAFVTSKVVSYISTCLVDANKVLICYYNDTDARPEMLVATVSTSTITINIAVECFEGYGAMSYISVSRLDTNKAIWAAANNNASTLNGVCGVLTVSGTVPSHGTMAYFQSYPTGNTSYVSVSALSSTSAIVAYQDGGNSNYGTAQVLSISGTTITPGTEYVFNSATTNGLKVCVLDSSNFVIAYQDGGASSYGYAVIGTWTTEITYGSESEFNSAVTSYPNVFSVGSNKVLFTYRDGTPLGQSRLAEINTSTKTFTYLSETTFNAADTTYIDSCYLGIQKSIIVYRDYTNSNFGTAVVNTWTNSDYSSVRGIATANTASGSDAVILLNGIASGLSSIIPGSQYYLDASFGMTTAPVSLAVMKNSSLQTGEIYLGTGLSTSTMYFSPDYK